MDIINEKISNLETSKPVDSYTLDTLEFYLKELTPYIKSSLRIFLYNLWQITYSNLTLKIQMLNKFKNN